MRYRRSIVGFGIVPVRRIGTNLQIDRRRGLGWRDLAGWRLILPRLYIVVLFRRRRPVDPPPPP